MSLRLSQLHVLLDYAAWSMLQLIMIYCQISAHQHIDMLVNHRNTGCESGRGLYQSGCQIHTDLPARRCVSLAGLEAEDIFQPFSFPGAQLGCQQCWQVADPKELGCISKRFGDGIIHLGHQPGNLGKYTR